ncbi:MAG TPA: HU family DNA-binding protein [Gammaproteobacteria bacterium]|nr:HU family DNA-binding protein [Gammaproteobacteria bacterium]HET7569530.1 HU family DNA-binding protein [Gammaproteobacteria bacterium]HET8551190.1 HU family DNA-binding protein [Gammaproteobacteria bacterium]
MAAKKAAAKKTSAANPKPMTKSEIYSHLAAETDLTKREIGNVFDALNGLIKKNVGRRGPGVFALPGLMKIKVVKKPATKARKGTNPFTGEPTVFKAKPARKAVKVQPLKGLKDML